MAEEKETEIEKEAMPENAYIRGSGAYLKRYNGIKFPDYERKYEFGKSPPAEEIGYGTGNFIWKQYEDGRITEEEMRAKYAAANAKRKQTYAKRRQLRELANDILNTTLDVGDDKELARALAKRGLEPTEANAMLFKQLAKAKDGDTDAARFIRDTAGQKPADNVKVSAIADKPFEDLNLEELSNEELIRLARGED